MRFISYLVFFIILLVSCSPSNSGTPNQSTITPTQVNRPTVTPSNVPVRTPTAIATYTPSPTPTSELGKATAIGQIMHEDGYPMGNTIIRLGKVIRGSEGHGGKFILDLAHSPGAITDENGNFIIENFEDGEYVIVVGDVEATGIYEIVSEANGQAKIWNFPADEITDVGVITVKIIIPTPYPTREPGVYPAPTTYPNPQ